MYQFITGNIFDSKSQCLVDAVNCLGVKGAGLALQFKRKFPASFEHYQAYCRSGQMQPGKVLVSKEQSVSIVHFPTKFDWREPSRLEWIESGLEDLIDRVDRLKIESIAIPQLGCGLGGLNWIDVRPLIVAAAEQLPDCHVEIYGSASKCQLDTTDYCVV